MGGYSIPIDDELDDELQQAQGTRIARSNGGAATSLRGVNPNPAPASEDENKLPQMRADAAQGLTPPTAAIAQPTPTRIARPTPQPPGPLPASTDTTAPHIAKPSSSGPATPPLTLRGISPETEARTRADQAELQRQQRTGSGISQIQHGSPEGGIGIARPHPIAGGFLRGLNTVGTIAEHVAPILGGVMTAIPGTEEHHNYLMGQQRGRLGEDIGEQTAEAGIGEKQAAGEKDVAQANAANRDDALTRALLTKGYTLEKDPTTGEPTLTDIPGFQREKPEPIFDKAGGIIGFQTGEGLLDLNSPKLTPEMKAIAGAAKTKPAPGETQEQNKLGFQAVIGKLDAARLPTDVRALDKSLDLALKQGVITPQEHAAARSYQAANPTPGTNLTVHVAGQEEGNKLAINKLFEGKEVLAHLPDGRRVQMSYADAKAQNIPPERLVALNPKEAQDTRDKAASVKTTFQGLDRYRTDFKNSAPTLTPQDRDALRVLAAHNQSGQTGGILAGFVDDIPLAGPLSSYANKLLEGTMTSDQYKQLSPAGKKLVSDYSTAIIDNFANMKAIMGTVGRNPQMIQAEVNTLPPPYLDWESAQIQFENKRASLQGRAQSLPELYAPGAK